MTDEISTYGDQPPKLWPAAEFPWEIQSDVNVALLGEFLGEGVSRDVYRCRLNPDLVVKVETRGDLFQNVIEWRVWRSLEDTPNGKFLAPCEWISPGGHVLLQRYGEPVVEPHVPKDIPWFLKEADSKPEHWRRIGRRLVCVDYALIGSVLSEALSHG